MLWGLSSALDMVSEYEKVNSVFEKNIINILLIGSTDGRHILKTISSLRRHNIKDFEVNFFVMDLTTELIARQLLFLTIALEPEDRLGIQEKARLWMELYGNTLLRPVTAKYLMSKAVQLIHIVTDKNYQKKRLPLVALDHVKYREIDRLENIFKYWIHNRTSIAKIWDIKLRKSLGTRYDARDGIFDWDYNMKIREIEGGTRVCFGEYKFWRRTGIAFTWLETEYSIGNPTLAVGVGCSGDSYYSLGYLGDMVSGPFFAFGTDSEEKKMLEVRNDVNVRRATDITERNLQRMFYELEYGVPPGDLYAASIDLGLVMMKPGNVDVEKETILDYEPDRKPEDYSAIPVPNCKVFFLPGNAMEVFPKKAKYKEFFDIAFVAQNFFKFLNKDILSMVKLTGRLLVETRKFVIGLDKDTGSFGKEVRNKLHELRWQEVTKCHFRRDDHALFRRSDGSSSSEKCNNQQNAENADINDDLRTMDQVATSSKNEECAQRNLDDEKCESESKNMDQVVSTSTTEKWTQLNLDDKECVSESKRMDQVVYTSTTEECAKRNLGDQKCESESTNMDQVVSTSTTEKWTQLNLDDKECVPKSMTMDQVVSTSTTEECAKRNLDDKKFDQLILNDKERISNFVSPELERSNTTLVIREAIKNIDNMGEKLLSNHRFTKIYRTEDTNNKLGNEDKTNVSEDEDLSDGSSSAISTREKAVELDSLSCDSENKLVY